MSDAAAQQGMVPGSQQDPTGRERGQPSQGFNPFSDPWAAAAGPCWGSSAAPTAEPRQSAAALADGRQASAALPSEEALGRPLLPRERALRRLAALRQERGLPTAEQALVCCQVGFCCGCSKSSYLIWDASTSCMQAVHVEAVAMLPQGVACSVCTPL